MKVKVLSDLHLEFERVGDQDFDPGTGDVLILAGDVCDAAAFVQRCDVDLAERYQRFFKRCAMWYDKVFYVMGNHEHYNGFFNETADILRENLPEGITLLDNQSEFYNGWHFVGATLWSNFGGGDKECMRNAVDGLNDYNYIHTTTFKPHQDSELTRINPLTPEFILKENENTVTWLNQCLPTLNGPVFVVTHHCPSFESIDLDYADSDVVTAYASDLTGLINKFPNLKVWAHGHIHSSKNYQVGECTIVSNPRGYPGKGRNSGFNANFEMELPTNEKTR